MGEQKTISVPVLSDLIAEPGETFFVNLSEATGTGVSIGDAQAIGTITDDDAASFTIGDATVAEGGGTLAFTVTLGAAVQGGAMVKYATANQTALAGSDYTAVSGTLEFSGNVGEQKTISVTVLNDLIAEPGETFFVNLSEATGTGVSIGDAQAIGTITDDDSFTISLSGFSVTETNVSQTKNFIVTMTGVAQNALDVSFTTTNGTALSGSDYTGQSAVVYSLAAGQQSLNIPVVILGDQLSENEETFVGTIVLSNVNGQSISIATGSATATIIDDDKADLVITKTISTGTPTVGSNVTFAVTVNNVGPSATSAIVVNDVLPSGYTLVSATPSTGTWTAPNWSIPTLANGASANISIIAKVLAVGSYKNTASITSSAIEDPVLTNNTASVTPVIENSSPVAVADNYSTNEDTGLTVSTPGALLNDTDIDGDVLSVSSFIYASTTYPVGIPATLTPGSLTINSNGSLSYIPAENYNGSFTVSYNISDGTTTASSQITITVSAVNDPPVVNPDYIYTSEGIGENIFVLNNDNDAADGTSGGIDPSSLKITKQPTYGSMTILANKQVSYTPNSGFFGTDQAEYEVCDNGSPAICAKGIIYIDVTRLSPLANDDSADTNEDNSVDINVVANDEDVNNNIDPSTVIIVTLPTHGTATHQGNGIVRYVPSTNYNGTDFFTYTVKDKTNFISNVARVDVTIKPIADAPVSTNGWYSTKENVEVVIPIRELVTDPDDDIDFSTIVRDPEALHGIISAGPNPGELIYTPNSGYTGNDSFQYNVADATGLRSNTSTVTIQVSNQAPTAVDDVFSVYEDEPSPLNVIGNDTDPQDNLDPTLVSIVTNPVNGTVVVDAVTGAIEYTSNLDYNGSDSFVYRVCDVTGYCDEATVSLTVLAVNDAPVAIEDSRNLLEENSVFIDVLANDYDVDNAIPELAITIVLQPLHGTVQVVSDPDGIIYTRALNYDESDSFSYRITDPEGLTSETTVILSITPVNDYIPSTFSPNGDGFNDFWEIKWVEDFPDNELFVYNRWGSLVYHKKPYDNPWDGKASSNVLGSEDLPEGTYFYILKLNDKKTLKGSVYIKR